MVAEELGAEFDFIRVDLYNTTDNEIIFGEMTVAPASGMGRFIPREYDYEFGSHWRF